MKISDIRVAIKNNKIKFSPDLFACKKQSPLVKYLKSFLKSRPNEDRALTLDEEFEFAQALFANKDDLPSCNEAAMAEELRTKLWGENAEGVFSALGIIYEYDHLDPTYWPEKYEQILQARRRAVIAAYLMVSLPLARETAYFIEFIKQPGLPLDLIYASIRELEKQGKLSGQAVRELEKCQLDCSYSGLNT